MHGKGTALIAVWIYKTLIALCHAVLQIERAGFYFILFYGLPEADSKAMAKNQNTTPTVALHRENCLIN